MKTFFTSSRLIAACLMSLAIMIGALPLETAAAPVTYTFTGAIGEVSFPLFTSNGTGSNGFNTGLTLSGQFEFNPLAVPTSLTSTAATYGNAVSRLSFNIGSYASPDALGGGLTGVNYIKVANGATDAYQVAASALGPLVKNLAPSIFEIDLQDGGGTAFTNLALPGAPAPQFSVFNLNRWKLIFKDGSFVQGSLTSLQAVPLPATVLLFGAGLVALVGLGAGGVRNLGKLGA
jgi:hypothetical protein